MYPAFCSTRFLYMDRILKLYANSFVYKNYMEFINLIHFWWCGWNILLLALNRL